MEVGTDTSQGLDDLVGILDLRWIRTAADGRVCGGCAFRLDDEFADIGLPARPDSLEHPHHPVVVQRIVARLGRRYGNERQCRRLLAKRTTEGGGRAPMHFRSRQFRCS